MNFEWLPARSWNDEILGNRATKIRPLQGAHTLLITTPKGSCLCFDDSTGWRHPWSTTPNWDGKKWTATVLPGFVNGVPPTYGTISLLDTPIIPLTSFRNPGGSGDPTPEFFKFLGIGSAAASGVSINQNTGAVGVVSSLSTDGSTPAIVQLLMACDLYISVARATYSLSTTITGNYLTGQLVNYSVGYETSALVKKGTHPFISVGAIMPPTVTPTLSDQFMGVDGDDGEDRKLICTIYFLSPPNPTNSNPDGSWTPFVCHKGYGTTQGTFWNLCHASKNTMPVNVQQQGLDGTLMVLLGQYTLAPTATLGAMNAEMQSTLEAVLNTTTNAGKFWST